MMAPRTKLNITLVAMIGTIILLVMGVMQRQANPRQGHADKVESIARRRLVFTVEDLLDFAAKTPQSPQGTFPSDLFPAELEERSGASAYFENDPACWHALQTKIKSNLNKPILLPYREPSQPEPLLIYIEFDQGEQIILKFVQDALVNCQLPGQQ